MPLTMRSLLEEHYLCVSDIRTGFSHAPLVIAKFAMRWWDVRRQENIRGKKERKKGDQQHREDEYTVSSGYEDIGKSFT
jgi:hypothetical protein